MLLLALAGAQRPKIIVDATDIRGTIPATLYGSCIEDVNHEIYGGLYGQLLYGESFEEPGKDVSGAWDPINGQCLVDTTTAFTGRQSQAMTGPAGIANRGLNRWGIAVIKGKIYKGYVYLKGDGPVTIRLEDGRTTYGSATITDLTPSWKRYEFAITARATNPKARLAIYLKRGRVWIDQACLMTPDRFKGLPLRRDIAEKMQQEGLRFLRYGGSMVNAPDYRWKNMTGPSDKRPPYNGHWYPYSSNGFGITEFVRFCRAAGFEPAFAINDEDDPDDIASMVDSLRQYDIHYIEIGNEEVIWGDIAKDYDHYAERFNLLSDAIHRKNPNIKIICAAWWRPASPNMERVFHAIDGKAAYWDLHTDADDPKAGDKVDKELTDMQRLFREWNPKTTLKCVIFEENGGHHDLARALGHATTLNAVRRHGDFVLTSCAANALQPLGQNDNGWDQGQIFFTPSHVWGMPPFYAQQMASANHEPLLVADSTDSGMDVTATRSRDGRTLVIHVVNTSTTPVTAAIDIQHFRAGKTTVTTLQGDTPIYSRGLPRVFPGRSYTIIRLEE